MLGYDTLMNHFRTNFALMHHHKWSLEAVEQMMPWEKFIYVDMLKQHMQYLEDLQRDQAAARRVQTRTHIR
jgi:hypothetical protein